MTLIRRLLPTVVFAAVLTLPAGVALGQDDVAESAAPEATVAADDPRLTELEALVPPALAGLPLTENLQVATGEQMVGVMEPEEAAVLGDLLEANGKTTADYAAAATYIPVTDAQVVVIQAHRITGVPAAETIDAWVEILSMNLADPQVSEGFIGGRAVTLMSDGDNPEAPLLHMFPAADVVWMMWTDDEALVGAAMDEVDADEPDEAEASE